MGFAIQLKMLCYSHEYINNAALLIMITIRQRRFHLWIVSNFRNENLLNGGISKCFPFSIVHGGHQNKFGWNDRFMQIIIDLIPNNIITMCVCVCIRVCCENRFSIRMVNIYC